MNCTIFDIETTFGPRPDICAIGFIRYENNEVVSEKEIYIKPGMFPQVWHEIASYFERTNLMSYDVGATKMFSLYETLEAYQLPAVCNNYVSALKLLQCMSEDEEETTCKQDVWIADYGAERLSHQGAMEGARECFRILKRFQELHPAKDVPKTIHFLTIEG